MGALDPRTVMFGNPPSSGHRVIPSDLMDWMQEVQSLAAGGGLSYVNGSLAALASRTGVVNGQFGLVLSSASEAGVYERDGGSWAKVADVPAVFLESIAAQETLSYRNETLGYANAASGAAAQALASKEAAALIANFDPDDYFKTANGAAGWGLRNLSSGLHILADVDDPTLASGLYGTNDTSQGGLPSDWGVLMVLPYYAVDGSGIEQVTQKFWPAVSDPAEYGRNYREGSGWSAWHRVISSVGDQHFAGAVKSDRDMVVQRPDGDAVFRLNKGNASRWAIRRRHSDDAMVINSYDGAEALINISFAGYGGFQARIVPKGDVSDDANLLTRFAGDARYQRNIAPFQSAELAFAGGVLIAAAHGLGRVPHHWRVVLRCKVANNGYAVGDEIDATSMSDGDSGRGKIAKANATELSFFSEDLTLQNNVGNTVHATGSDWAVVFYAW